MTHVSEEAILDVHRWATWWATSLEYIFPRVLIVVRGNKGTIVVSIRFETDDVDCSWYINLAIGADYTMSDLMDACDIGFLPIQNEIDPSPY